MCIHEHDTCPHRPYLLIQLRVLHLHNVRGGFHPTFVADLATSACANTLETLYLTSMGQQQHTSRVHPTYAGHTWKQQSTSCCVAHIMCRLDADTLLDMSFCAAPLQCALLSLLTRLSHLTIRCRHVTLSELLSCIPASLVTLHYCDLAGYTLTPNSAASTSRALSAQTSGLERLELHIDYPYRRLDTPLVQQLAAHPHIRVSQLSIVGTHGYPLPTLDGTFTCTHQLDMSALTYLHLSTIGLHPRLFQHIARGSCTRLHHLSLALCDSADADETLPMLPDIFLIASLRVIQLADLETVTPQKLGIVDPAVLHSPVVQSVQQQLQALAAVAATSTSASSSVSASASASASSCVSLLLVVTGCVGLDAAAVLASRYVTHIRTEVGIEGITDTYRFTA